MENSTIYSCRGIPRQATVPCFLLYFKDELIAARQKPGIDLQRPPEKFTKEAIFMICVILAFVLLAVSGTLITVYEFLFSGKNANYVKSKYSRNVSNKPVTKKNGSEKQSPGNNGSFEDCKSFLKCFCVLKNGSKILNTTSAKGQVDSIQGLRFIFNIFVISVHVGLILVNLLKNIQDLKPLMQMRVFQLFVSGTTIVNIFFVISAYLNAKSFFSKYSKSNGNFSWFDFYFKRFMRLTPVYMIVLGFYTTLLTYTGSGILWPSYNTNPICKKKWWWNLFYINNIEGSSKECMAWCWYLAVDMQLYIVSPLFMISLLKWPRIGYALAIAAVIGASITSFVLTYVYNLIDGFSRIEFHIADFRGLSMKFWVYFDLEYSMTFPRISNYLVGILLAYYLHKKQINKDVIKNGPITLCCGWIVSSIMMWISIFSLHKRAEILVETALFNSTKNLLFSCVIAWVMYLCITEQAGFLGKCLSWKYFLPLSRLSYCAYLIHPLFIARRLFQTENLVDYSIMSMVNFNSYVCILTYAASFIISMLFEIPVQNLLDWFGKHKRREDSTKTHRN